MNTEPTRTINIDGKNYDAEALSKTCIEKLNAVQTHSSGVKPAWVIDQSRPVRVRG